MIIVLVSSAVVKNINRVVTVVYKRRIKLRISVLLAWRECTWHKRMVFSGVKRAFDPVERVVRVFAKGFLITRDLLCARLASHLKHTVHG